MKQRDIFTHGWLAISLAVAGASIAVAAPPPGTPKVTLSEKHAATCLVKVGDPFPEMTLTDAKGAGVKLETLRGGRPAVVVFWKGNHHARKEMMEDLSAVAKMHGVKVAIAAVHVGGPPGNPVAAAAQVQQAIDPQGAGYALLAKGEAKMPRIYLLDATGAIIWMDIEYAVDTRRQLGAALEALFPKAGPAAAN